MATPVSMGNPDTETLPAEWSAGLAKVTECITENLPLQHDCRTQEVERKLEGVLQNLSSRELVAAIFIIVNTVTNRAAESRAKQPQVQQVSTWPLSQRNRVVRLPKTVISRPPTNEPSTPIRYLTEVHDHGDTTASQSGQQWPNDTAVTVPQTRPSPQPRMTKRPASPAEATPKKRWKSSVGDIKSQVDDLVGPQAIIRLVRLFKGWRNFDTLTRKQLGAISTESIAQIFQLSQSLTDKSATSDFLNIYTKIRLTQLVDSSKKSYSTRHKSLEPIIASLKADGVIVSIGNFRSLVSLTRRWIKMLSGVEGLLCFFPFKEGKYRAYLEDPKQLPPLNSRLKDVAHVTVLDSIGKKFLDHILKGTNFPEHPCERMSDEELGRLPMEELLALLSPSDTVSQSPSGPSATPHPVYENHSTDAQADHATFESEIHEGAIGTSMQEQRQPSASPAVPPSALSERPCAANMRVEPAVMATPHPTADRGMPSSPSQRFYSHTPLSNPREPTSWGLNGRKNLEPRPSVPPMIDNHNASLDDGPCHIDGSTSAPSENPYPQGWTQSSAAMSDQHASSGNQPDLAAIRSLFDLLGDEIDWDTKGVQPVDINLDANPDCTMIIQIRTSHAVTLGANLGQHIERVGELWHAPEHGLSNDITIWLWRHDVLKSFFGGEFFRYLTKTTIYQATQVVGLRFNLCGESAAMVFALSKEGATMLQNDLHRRGA